MAAMWSRTVYVITASLALLQSPALCKPNASVEHATYDAADLSVAKQASAEGQELQDLLHWAICAPPARPNTCLYMHACLQLTQQAAARQRTAMWTS